MPDKVEPSGATPSRQSSNVHSVGTNGSGAASTGSSKKNDKKARRAAKVQQKEGSDTPPAATNQPGGAGEATKDNKSPEAAPHVPAEKKQLSKAERRAKQEAQRQAKLEKQTPEESKKPEAASGSAKKDTEKPTESASKNKTIKSSKSSDVHFFSHLPAHRSVVPKPDSQIHPTIVQIGLRYASGVICGSNARAVALLCALTQYIGDYKTPEHKDLARDLHSSLKKNVDFLNKCRPLSVSMLSVIKYLTPIITNNRLEESEAKKHLIDELSRFYNDRIQSSDDMIARKVDDKIVNGDVIVTFGHSSLVLKSLTKAAEANKQFSIIVVDSRPKLEGREMLRKLVKACPGVSCSYVFINAISYIMSRATKVLLGAHAVLANGYVMSRLGTSQIALMAKAYNVPLLVCCETYKFSDKMQTDSFVANELGDKQNMIEINNRPGPLADLSTNTNLHALNLCYDVTPPDYVTGLITETGAGLIPCSSAPVVIRVKQQYDFVPVK